LKKTILITGASGGIGKETTLYFAKNGWTVIATMISIDLADDLATTPNVFCYELDVTSTESITNAKATILSEHKTINVVLNNAGLGYRSFVELSEDNKIDNIVNVNWLGAVKVCRAFIPVFREQNFGQFITISSIAGEGSVTCSITRRKDLIFILLRSIKSRATTRNPAIEARGLM
jgi:NADP-dependent 3-hydroxy acid dehydrogenase YdfG